jgi:hypothetical protein
MQQDKMSVNRASTERQHIIITASSEPQRFCVLHLVLSKDCAMAFIINWSIGSLYRQYRMCQYCCITNWSSTEHQLSVNWASIARQQSIHTASTEWQQSVNDFVCCILCNPTAVLRQLPIIISLAAVMRDRDPNMITAPVSKWASTERYWFWVLHLV